MLPTAVQGSVLYRNATTWVALGPGSASDVLTSGGAGADVSWTAVTGTLPAGVAGDILYHNGTTWVTLAGAASTTDRWLTSNGTTVFWSDPTPTQLSGTATTTDDTQTQLITTSVATNRSLTLVATVAANADSTGDRASYQLIANIYNTGAGATVNNIYVVTEDESDPTWQCTFTTSGNDVRVSVTGIIGNTINWAGQLQVVQAA